MKLVIVVLLSIVCGCLGAYAGSQNTSKAWRRYGIPFIIVVFGCFHTWWSLLSLSLIGILSSGYGIPDGNDSGSSLGRFWYKVFDSHKMIDVGVRGTIGLLIIISCLYAPILSQKWVFYGVSAGVYLLIHILFTAIISGEPVIKTGNKQFLVEDFIAYAALGAFCLGNQLCI